MAVTNDFSSSALDLNGKVSLSQPTALVWGDDGRLYVTENGGQVNVLTIQFGDSDPNDGDPTASFYVAEAVQLAVTGSGGIVNHNDDGNANSSNNRQVTGIDVTNQYNSNGERLYVQSDGSIGTTETDDPAQTMYVTSSDSRVGAGGSGNDLGLDTNSGIITMFTQTGPDAWDQVDIVRGLPRSEENHATNGLEMIQELDGNGNLVSERLIVASGGNANTGAPSNNFAGQQEQPLSAAILEIDITGIKALPVQDDNGRAYVLDLPTLDDPTQPGTEDNNEPFGGNDGLNSAVLEYDSLVTIYSPGYRNSYDVEVTEDGRVWTYDNGANDTWGGRPVGENSPGNGTTDPDQLPGYIATNLNNGDGSTNDDINFEPGWDPSNNDQFHEVTRSDDLDGRDLSEGAFGAPVTYTGPDGLDYVYGGHPNPTRAEGALAGLLFSPGAGTDDAFLLVSDQDTYSQGSSDYDQVIAFYNSIGAPIQTILEVTPGINYNIYKFGDGSGAAVPVGDPAPPGGQLLGQSGLPADIADIVDFRNSVEGNYLEGGRADGALDSGKGSINGLAEYTSTILDDGTTQMSGAILATVFNGGNIIAMGRNADGTMSSVQNGINAQASDRTIIDADGGPLGIATIGDDFNDMGLSKAFQGSIWTAVYKGNNQGGFSVFIEVLQPGNADDNAVLGSQALYAGQEIVDENDQDLDGVDKFNDPFEFSAENGFSLSAGEKIVLDFDAQSAKPEFDGTLAGNTGLLGAALDGPNSAAGPLASAPGTNNIQEAGATANQDALTGSYLDNAGDLLDPSLQQDGLFDLAGNIIPGGNAPILQIKEVVPGTMVGAANTARDVLHTGIKPTGDVGRIQTTVTAKNWVAAAGAVAAGQVTGVTFGDGTQSNFLRFVFGDVNGQPGLEVGYELNDSGYQALAEVALPGLLNTNNDLIDLRLEIDIANGYEVSASYRLGPEGSIAGQDFVDVPLGGFTLPAGVLQNVLNGTHTISDGDTTLSSGAAIGIVAETTDGNALKAIDFPNIEIEAFGNEIFASTEAEAEQPGTAGPDTIFYDGPAATINLDAAIEDFDGSASDADWNLVANDLDNTITVGSGSNIIATGEGSDMVVGTIADLDGTDLTDFSTTDKVVFTDGTLGDASGVAYGAGSAIITLNGSQITFSGSQFDTFDPADGPVTFQFVETSLGLELSLIPDETILYRVNAGSSAGPGAAQGTIAAIDGGPDWLGDADLIDSDGPVSLTGATTNTYSNGLTDTEAEIDYDNVDAAVVPWQVFVNERSDNASGDPKLTYNFDVEVGGTYKIELFYTENWVNIFGFTSGNGNSRQFDVAVEGQVPAAFTDLNPLAEAVDFVGSPAPTDNNAPDGDKQPFLGVARKAEYTYTATDDTLTLEWLHDVENPKVNAIQITQLGGVINPPTDTTPPEIVSIDVENPPGLQDGPRDMTVVLSDNAGFDLSDFALLDGSEVSFTGAILPSGISAPVVVLSNSDQTATLTYTLQEPTEPASGWPTALGNVEIAEGAYSDASGNTTAAASDTFVSNPNGDDLVLISVADVTVDEGDDAQVTFTRTGDDSEAITVTYSVLPGTATADDDYTPPVTNTVVVPASSPSATIAIPTVDDDDGEGAETFTVTIVSVQDLSGNAAIDSAGDTGTVTISANDNPLQIPDGGTILLLDFETDGEPLDEGGFDDVLGGPGALDTGVVTIVSGGQLIVNTSNGDLSQASATASKNDFVKAVDLSDPSLTEIYVTTQFSNPFTQAELESQGITNGVVPNYAQLGIVIATDNPASNQDAEQFQKVVFGGNGGNAAQMWSQGPTETAQTPSLTAMSDAAVANGGDAFGLFDVASVELSLRLNTDDDTSGMFVTLFDASGNVLGGVRPEATAGFATAAPVATPPAVVSAIANGTTVVGVTSNDFQTLESFEATWDFVTVTSPQFVEGPEGTDSFQGTLIGDFSEDNTNPTDLTLAEGSNTLSTFAQGETEPGGRDYDYFTIVVPEGFELTAINVTDYSGDISNQAFIGLIDGETFPAPAADEAGFPALAAQLLGGAIVNSQGQDLLAAMATGSVFGQTTRGFDLPLEAGTYTLWHSQNGGGQKVDLDFVVQEAVAPDAVIGIADGTAVESGDAGDTTLEFTLTLVGSDPAAPVSVTYTVDGVEQTTDVTFVGGTATLQVLVPNDDVDNGDDAVDVVLTGVPAGFAIDPSAASATGTVSEDDVPVTGGGIVAAINAGGPALSQDGIDFAADEFFQSGSTFADGGSFDVNNGNGVQSGFDGTVYKTERFGDPLTYEIPVDAGNYEVELYFAEIFASEPGSRVFDVFVEGQLVLDDFDILAETNGDFNQPIVITVPTSVSPDTFGNPNAIDIELSASEDNAKISAIVVREAVEGLIDGAIAIGDVEVTESGDTGDTTLAFPLTITGPNPVDPVSITYSVDGVEQTTDVTFVDGAATLDIPVANDDEINGAETVDVVLLNVEAGFSIQQGSESATGTVNEDDTPFGFGPTDDLDQDGELNNVDTDIDGDGTANGDETFVYDGTNVGTALANAEVVRFEFDTDGTPFENGLTGALLSPNKPNNPEINLDNASVSGGTLNITATNGDHFNNNNTQENALVAGFTVEEGLSVETRFAFPDFDPVADGVQAPVNFQAAGVVIGFDQNNLVKAVFGRGTPEFQLVQDNANGGGTSDVVTGLPSGIAVGDIAEIVITLQVFIDDSGESPVAKANATATLIGSDGLPLPGSDQFSIGEITLENALADQVLNGDVLGAGVIQTSTNNPNGRPSFDVSYEYVEVTALGDPADDFDVTAPTDTDATEDAVLENAAAGTLVGITALATDADPANSGVTYSIIDDPNGYFAIDENTGVVTIANPIDRETAGESVTFTVVATSEDTSTASTTFSVAVGDENEFPVGAVIDSEAVVPSVSEDAAIGTAVGLTALAIDDDATTNVVSYSLSDDAGGLFAIDEDTGVVTVDGALDFETAQSHDITVVATSEDTSTSEETFTIAVTDSNETGVSIPVDDDPTDNAVAEGSGPGVAVGVTASAFDNDASDTVTYSLLGNEPDYFAIDEITGILTTGTTPIDRELVGETLNVTVVALSSDTSTQSQLFAITILDVNEFDVGPVIDVDATTNEVSESAPVGTMVGTTALATDDDATTNVVTYSLSNDAGGLFRINASTGVISTNAELDFETATNHVVTVLATSEDGSTSTEDFTISVTDVNETPITDPVNDDQGGTPGIDEVSYDGDQTLTLDEDVENVDLSGNTNNANGEPTVVLNDQDNQVEAGEGEHLVDLGEGDDDGADTVTGTSDEHDGDTYVGFDEEDKVIFEDGENAQIVDIEAGSAIVGIDTDGDGVAEVTITFEGDIDPTNVVGTFDENTGQFVVTVDPEAVMSTINEDADPVVIDATTVVPGATGVQNATAIDGQGISRTVTVDGTTITFDPSQMADDLDAGDVRQVTISYDITDGSTVTPATAELLIAGLGGSSPADAIRIQAEDFDSSTNITSQPQAQADAGEVTFLGSGTGSVTYDLSASGIVPGTYNVAVRYFDENDGASTIGLNIASTDVPDFDTSFVLDDDATSGDAAQAASARIKVFANVEIGPDATLTLDAIQNGGEFARVDYFEFTPVDDNGGGTDNLPPIAPLGLENQSIDEGGEFNYDAGAMFIDPDNEENPTLTFTATSDLPDGVLPDGVLFDEATGVFSGTPKAAGTYVFTVIANDGQDDSQPETFTLTVADINDEPIITQTLANQNLSVGDTVDIDLDEYFDDPDVDDVLTYTLEGDLPDGVSFVDGVFSGAPTETGPFVVTVTATDPDQESVSQTFAFNVSDEDDRETIRIQAEDLTLVPGDNGNQFFVSGAALGPVIRLFGNKTGEATENFDGLSGVSGTYSVTVGYYDESDGTSTASLWVSDDNGATYSELNGAGSSTWLWDDNTGTAGSEPGNFRTRTFEGLDVTEDTVLKLQVTSNVGEFGRVDWIELTPTGSNIDFGPFVAAGVDDLELPGIQDISIDLEAINAFSDNDEDPLTYDIVEGPEWLDIDGGVITGTPPLPGTYDVTVSATDGPNESGITVTTSFQIVVGDNNLPPELAFLPGANGTITVDEGGVIEDAIGFTDPEDGAITYALAEGSPDWLQIGETTGFLSGSPGPDDVGSVDVDVIATDNLGASTTQTITINVTDVNEAPVAGTPLDDQSAVVGQAFSFNLPAGAFTDADPGDVLTYSATLADGSPLPTWLSIDETTGALSGTPDSDVDFTVTVIATDIAGESATSNVNLIVDAVPQDPITVEAEDFTGAPTANYVVNNMPTASGGEILRILPQNATETVTHSLSEYDGQAFNLAITYIDETDGAGSGTAFVDGVEIGSWNFDGTDGVQDEPGADTGGFGEPGNYRTVTLETPFLVGPNSVLTLEVSSQAAEFGRLDKITLLPTTIGPVNTPPTLVGPAAVDVAENQTAVADFDATDPDIDDTLTFGLEGDDAGLFAIDADGVLTFVQAPDFEAPGDADTDNVYDVTVTVSDGTETTSQAVAVTVMDVADEMAEDEVVLRINAFGPEVVGTDGVNWQADLKDDLGTPQNENNQYLNLEDTAPAQDRGDAFAGYTGDTGLIPADVPEAVLDTARSSNGPFSYDIPLADIGGPGDFEVRLYFAELFAGNQTPGDRIFDIQVEGTSPGVLNNFDPSAPTGGGDLSVISYDVTVESGELNIRFAQDASDGSDNPIINAIEIVRKGDSGTADTDGPTAAIALTNPADVDAPLLVEVTLTDATGVDASTLGDDDLLVDASAGAVSFVGFANDVATYSVAAPVGGWQDGGDVNVTLQADQVADTLGNLNAAASQSITLDIGAGSAPGDVLLRINAFGPEVVSADDGPNWQADTAANPSPFYVSSQNRGDNDGTPATPNLDGVPDAIFATARSDDGPFAYNIPVSALDGVQSGDIVTVNLYFAEASDSPALQSPTSRIFDVTMEGALAIDDFSPIASFGAGGGGVISTVVQVVGDTLNLDFLNNNVQNAIVNGIEIVEGGSNPINGGTVDPPTDPTEAIEILEDLDDVDDNGSYGAGAVGSAELRIMEGVNNVQSSNFGANSFEIENTGDKQIAAVVIDFRDAIYGDSVIDFDGSAGDTSAKDFDVDSGGGTGAFFDEANAGIIFPGDDPLPNTTGTGVSSTGGFKGLLLKFDGSSGGFTNGEVVGFSGDMDPNAIAGLPKSLVDGGAVNSWDVGGVSGAELIGSRFTVMFDDGTFATGYLQSDGSQAGSVGEAVQGQDEKTVAVTVNGFNSSQSGTYGGTVPEIVVTGTAGDTVLVTMSKGLNPVTNNASGVADLVDARLQDAQSEFPVSNAADFQTFEVTIGQDGTATLPASAFDYNNPDGGQDFSETAYTNGFETAPIVVAASVIDPQTDMALGPVDRVYLTNPTDTPVDDGGIVDPPVEEGYFEIIGSGNNARFKVQIEDPNVDNGGQNPGGKWSFVTGPDDDDNQQGAQGAGYYLYGSDTSTALNNVIASEVLEYTILIPEGETGNYNFRFRVSRDGEAASDQQNDLWLNIKKADEPGFGDIEEYLTNTSNEPEPTNQGFIKVFGGPNNGNWGFASNFDGVPGNPVTQIAIDEPGLYTVQIAGRSQGYHVDYWELYKGSAPATGASDSPFITDDGSGGGPGNGGGPGTGDGELVWEIASQADDLETIGGSASSPDLEFADGESVALRFTGQDLPDGADVTAAYIQFTSENSSMVNGTLDFLLADTSDPSEIGNAADVFDVIESGNPFSLSTPIAWGMLSVNEEFQTGDILSLLEQQFGQDLVNLDSNDAIGLELSIDVNSSAQVHTWSGPGDTGPKLVIEYEVQDDTTGA